MRPGLAASMVEREKPKDGRRLKGRQVEAMNTRQEKNFLDLPADKEHPAAEILGRLALVAKVANNSTAEIAEMLECLECLARVALVGERAKKLALVAGLETGTVVFECHWGWSWLIH